MNAAKRRAHDRPRAAAVPEPVFASCFPPPGRTDRRRYDYGKGPVVVHTPVTLARELKAESERSPCHPPGAQRERRRRVSALNR